jgi:hypothetical protein
MHENSSRKAPPYPQVLETIKLEFERLLSLEFRRDRSWLELNRRAVLNPIFATMSPPFSIQR